MPLLSNEEIDSYVEKQLTDDFLITVTKWLKFSSEKEFDAFFARVRYASKRYLYLTQANPRRRTQGGQAKLLKDYKAALSKFKKLHLQVEQDNPTSAKLFSALRTEFEGLAPDLQNNISTHINASGYSMSSLLTFIDLLIKACDSATHKNIGNDDADLSKDFIVGWILAVRAAWPRNSDIQLGIGDYDKETGAYISPSADILSDIIGRVDDTVERKYIITLMREIIKHDIRQIPAFYLLGS